MEELELDEKVTETVPVYGFNTATGLPRAPALAFKRGSVFRFKAKDETGKKQLVILRQQLADLIQQGRGLGERTVEGFGRYLLDLDLHEKEYWKGDHSTFSEQHPFERSWQEETLQKVLNFLANHQARLFDSKGKMGPTPSQWQWLRQEARTATTDKQLESLFNDLMKRAIRLASRVQWQGVAEALKMQVDDIKEDSKELTLQRRKAFLDMLAQSVMALIRQRQKQGDESP